MKRSSAILAAAVATIAGLGAIAGKADMPMPIARSYSPRRRDNKPNKTARERARAKVAAKSRREQRKRAKR